MAGVKIGILWRNEESSPDNGNVDVEIHLPTGEAYSATFFTLNNISTLMSHYGKTGECADGLYMWASNMILVKEITEDVIYKVVADLVKTGEVHSACSLIAQGSFVAQ